MYIYVCIKGYLYNAVQFIISFVCIYLYIYIYIYIHVFSKYIHIIAIWTPYVETEQCVSVFDIGWLL